MDGVLINIFLIVSFFIMVLLVALAFVCMYKIVKTVLIVSNSKRPGITIENIFVKIFILNSLSLIFFPQYLTEEGLTARAQSFKYIGIFFFCFIVVFGLDWIQNYVLQLQK